MSNIKITAHAVDRASTRALDVYRKNRKPQEGLHSWLMRVCSKLLKSAPSAIDNETHIYNWRGLRWVFSIEGIPSLLTVMAVKDEGDRTYYD